jgi:lon-related putative ATP-dependent protease
LIQVKIPMPIGQDTSAMDTRLLTPTIVPTALAVADLRRSCNPRELGFASTAELPDVDCVPGQERALGAMRFGLRMRTDGYNLFAMGPEGIGRHTVVRQYLEWQAKEVGSPFDWCYVFNFEVPHKPQALRFPTGKAAAFSAGMQRLVDDLTSAVPAAFETDEYRNRRKEIEAELVKRQEAAVGEVGKHAQEQGIALVHTPSGFGFVPMSRDTVMTPEQFGKLPTEEQERVQQLIGRLQDELAAVLQEMPKWHREALRKIHGLNREVTATAIDSLIEDLVEDYRELPQVADYLAKVREDMLEHAEAFRQPKEGEGIGPLPAPMLAQLDKTETLRRYAVNVLIDGQSSSGAPVIYEDNPNHDALVGRIEHISQMGALVTDFTLIKPGALHRANGGYLILDATKVLAQPYAWEALKRALRAKEIRTQSLGQEVGLVSTVAIEPEPIPLQVKVVLIGERQIYYLLFEHDPEFGELFKVAADFEDDMPRSAANDRCYASLIATCARKERLRPLDAAAVARVIDQQVRKAGDAEKVSANLEELVDLLRESDYWAQESGAAVVSVEHIRHALEARQARGDRVRQRLLEDILRGGRLIDTSGSRTGQVNGLAVLRLGDAEFGTANRITARVRLGSGRVLDIERESELGGRIHSKGVLILSGFLAGRYAANKPLSLAASLVLEQNYGGVEGDSASAAELCALLSALADAPVRQSLAVTGSVNQHGDIQAIGGVNEKIEGFFDLCRARGLDGEQGVLIPRSNVKNLMLREDVVEAIACCQFHVYAIDTVDEGIALLTGMPADAINARVEQRLSDFAERARSFTAMPAIRRWQHARKRDK